jgi:acyl-CoA thioesterase
MAIDGSGFVNELAPTYEFDEDTKVLPVGEGVFAANITDRWNTWNGPNGGYIMSVAGRALKSVMPFRDPITSTAHFLRPVSPGPVKIETQVVREGRRLATAIATLFQDEKASLVMVSTFGQLQGPGGDTHHFDQMPSLPPIEDCVDPIEATEMDFSLTDRVNGRMKELPGWIVGKPSGLPVFEYWYSFADGRPPDSLALIFLADAAPPAVLELGVVTTSTVELTVHLRSLPTSQWLVYRKKTRHVMDGYIEEDCDIWDADGGLVAQSRQLALVQ